MCQLMLWGFEWQAAWQAASCKRARFRYNCPSLPPALCGACSKLSISMSLYWSVCAPSYHHSRLRACCDLHTASRLLQQPA